MSDLDYTLISFANLTVQVIARRIVALAQQDAEAAQREYSQHLGAMTEGEQRVFTHYIAIAAMECEDSSHASENALTAVDLDDSSEQVAS